MIDNAIITQSVQKPAHTPALDTAMDVLLYSLSTTSRRQYRHTFEQWQQWAADQHIEKYDMRPTNLIAFLEASDLAHSTTKARLSHLRKLLQTLHAQQPDNVAIKAMYEQAKLLKVQRNGGHAENNGYERRKTALTRQQVYQALDVWNGDGLQDKRNRALLAVLFYAGLRRSEAVALRWDDIDLNKRLIHVRHGKGDKARTIPLLGDDTPHEALLAWYQETMGRLYVFCGIRRGDHLGSDAPLTAQAAYNVIKATGGAIGVDFSPHDTRRTLLTNALAAGTSVADAQFIAGHARPDTTLAYAQVKDAQAVRGRVKLGY